MKRRLIETSIKTHFLYDISFQAVHVGSLKQNQRMTSPTGQQQTTAHIVVVRYFDFSSFFQQRNLTQRH